MVLVFLINLLFLESEIMEYGCTDKFIIELDKAAQIKCDSRYIELNYDEFSNYKFFVYNYNYNYKEYDVFVDFVNKSIDIDLYESNMEKIASSIQFEVKMNLIFTDFLNESAILTASKIFNSSLENINIWINMSWYNYMNFNNCPWIDGEYYNDYLYVKEYFEKINSKKTRWRKVCFPYSGYLFYQDETKGEIKFIPTGMFVGGIIAAVLIIVAVIVSLYYIARCRFKKDVEKMNDKSDEELDNYY